MSSSAINASSKLKSFAQKFVKPAPASQDGTPIPAPNNDIFQRMDLGSKMSQDNSLDETIDVFPDTRYIVKYIIYKVMKIYKTLDQEAPLLTPSSFVAYCLIQIYAFALINDLYGRPHPSFPADQFMDKDSRSNLLDALCNSYVPPFMLEIYHALSNTSDPKRPGLNFFCTLAGSRFKTDFGRFIPPSIFLHAHNMSTEADTSRNVAAAVENLAKSVIFKDTTQEILAANYLSMGIEDNTYYDSWLLHAVKTLFSPVTGKSLLRRSNIESVILEATSISMDMDTDSDTDNQYVAFLVADQDNIYSTNEFVAAFSNLIEHAFPTSVKLGAVPDSQSGINITTHGYSLGALPTYHSRQLKHDTSPLALTTKLRTTTYAEKIKFLQPTSYVKKEDLEYPDDSKKAFPPQFLLFSSHKHDDTQNPDKEMKFDPELHEFPVTHYLSPYEKGDGPISYAMIAGLIIESFEVDASSVPMPDSQVGLAVNNRQFLQGALPLHYIHKAYTGTVAHNITPVPRTVARSRVQKIAHDLYNTSEHRLGYLDLDTDHAGTTTPVGFNLVGHVRNIFHMFNRIALSSNAPSPKPPVQIHVWSPYRYVLSRKEEQPEDKSTFMIFNHRTLYGTSIPLVSTRHPAEVIPLS